jgi:cysteine desulfurase
VQNTANLLERQHGFEVDVLPVDKYGRVDPGDVAASISSRTAFVSVIYANNEIGTINPISEIGQICRQRGVLFHTDAVQASAHLPMDVQRDSVDLLSIGAHKFYGPKGIGVLYVRRGVKLEPTQTGGAQESGLRAGTHNVPYIVGMAEALTLAQKRVEENRQHLQPLRDYLIERVLDEVPQARLTGHPAERLPNHSSFVFEGVDGNALLVLLDQRGFACSSGSACKVGDPKPSEVLEAIGLSRSWALGSLRVTLGRGTTKEQIESFLAVLPEQVELARKL